MGLHYTEITVNTVMYDSVNYGCAVTNVETSQNETVKSEGIFVFVVINNENPLQVSFSERLSSYYYFLVSSVVTVAGYDKLGMKINAGTEFTMYYQDITNTTEHVHKISLSIITYIGCSISLVTLFIALTIFTFIRSLNSERVFVHRNLCIAILAAQVVFIAGNKANQQPIVCRVAALFLHYCFLSIFTWMLVEGIHLYTKVVQVFGTDNSRTTYYLCFGWGIPFCLVMISAVADWKGYGQDANCWLSIDRHTIWAFIGPAVAVIMGFFVFLFHCILNTEVRQTLTRIRDRHTIQMTSSSSSSSSSIQSVHQSTEMAIHGTLRFRLEYVGDVKMYSHDANSNYKMNTPKRNKRKANNVTNDTKQTELTRGIRRDTGKHSHSSSDLELVYM
ncbi:G-protein coupled receptor 2 [Mactra antiquata]